MAKKPEDRYQTPAEVAAALALPVSPSNGFSLAATELDRTTVAAGRRVVAGTENSTNELNSPFGSLATDKPKAVDSSQRLRRQAQAKRFLVYAVAGGLFVLVGIVVFLILFLKEPARAKVPVTEENRAVVAKAASRATAHDAWLRQVAALPAKEQVDAVVAKLKELNSGFDGKVTHKVESGMVTSLEFLTDKVTDLSPVRAFTGLRTLICNGIPGKGQLADLSPLKGMKLTELYCNYTLVSDLLPLKDMKLTSLHFSYTLVPDLSPLKDMKLLSLYCYHTPVSDLSPLKDMKLTYLFCGRTKVCDLSPLKDMKLTELNCSFTPVSDLTPLKDMKLTTLGCHGTPVSDLTPLKNMKLTTLICYDTKVSDLTLLEGMPLTELRCSGTKVADLSPLKDMKLTSLDCHRTLVSNLSPLKDMKLTKLACDHTAVSDLSPLKGMPLKELSCDFKPERDAEILRSIKTLETINDKLAKEFWKEVDGKKP